jgi:restriction endonuclease Mrr
MCPECALVGVTLTLKNQRRQAYGGPACYPQGSSRSCLLTCLEARVAVPDFQSLMRPCLTVHQDRQSHTPTDLRDRLATQLRISDEDRAVMLPSGRQSLFANRVAWAVTHMAQAGLLDRPARGVTQITDRGIEVLNQYPDRVNMKVLSRFPEYAEFRARTKQRRGQQPSDTVAVARETFHPGRPSKT